jgi:hypothetical protein
MDKICPYCQGQHLIKNGSAYGVPKWKCKDCGRQTSFKPPRGEPLWKKETAVLLYTLGLSMNAIAKQLGVSTPSILNWIRVHAATHAPSTGAGRERGCHGTGRTLAFPSKKKNKLWIWLAFDRSGQRRIDWECGNRDAATLNRLLERLTTSSAGAQAQRSKTLERHAVLYRRLWALPHAPAGWAALYRQG